MKRVTTALFLALSLAAPGAMSPATAQSCYSTEQVRAAVQGGQVLPLSNFIPQIQAAAPGQIVSWNLCVVGGRYVYLVSVLVGGQVLPLQVDAITGAVTY